jgi:uncharacterized protein (DUF1330 family)
VNGTTHSVTTLRDEAFPFDRSHEGKRMSASWVTRVYVKDPESYAKYAALAGSAVAKHGGIFLARGGGWIGPQRDGFERTVIARFPSVEAAEKCYRSAEYAEAREYVVDAAETHKGAEGAA